MMKSATSLVWAVALLATAPAAAADLIITNAKLFAADATKQPADAVVVTGERISFVGPSASALKHARANTRIIDARGRLLTPGLIEAHTHSGADIPGQRVQMPGGMWPGPSPEQAIDAVRTAAPSGQGWIIATIGPATTSEPRDWRRELDLVSRGRPVRLRA